MKMKIMAEKMKQFHVLPKFGPENSPPIFVSMARFCFYLISKASKICCQTVLFRCGTTCCLLYQRASLRCQQGCTTCFTKKQRGISIFMPLSQSVCRPYFPIASGQNETTCPQIYSFTLFFSETLTSCPLIQIFGILTPRRKTLSRKSFSRKTFSRTFIFQN